MGETPPSLSPTADKPEEALLPAPLGEELTAALEALLFATHIPLDLRRLNDLLGNPGSEKLEENLEALRQRYASRASGLMLMEVAGGWQLATKAELADYVLALHKHRRRTGLSPALMETLAIIAYKQPLVKAEIEAIRGVDCGGVIRSLLDAGLIEVVGHRETVGRPSLYGTTETFLKTFGLRTLDDMPSLGDFRGLLQPQPEPEPQPPPAVEAAVPPPELPATEPAPPPTTQESNLS